MSLLDRKSSVCHFNWMPKEKKYVLAFTIGCLCIYIEENKDIVWFINGKWRNPAFVHVFQLLHQTSSTKWIYLDKNGVSSLPIYKSDNLPVFFYTDRDTRSWKPKHIPFLLAFKWSDRQSSFDPITALFWDRSSAGLNLEHTIGFVCTLCN
jgi:hypothetical protein